MRAAVFFKDRSLRSQKTELWINYLVVALGFTLPISVAANNIILALILILWLIGGDFKKKWERIKSNEAAIAIILFFLLHFIGLIYSSDLKTGLFDVIKREVILLFMPIILSVIREEYIKKALNAFLAAMFISEIISYLLYFEILTVPWRKHASSIDPNPFMSHISYSPLLAFAVILLLHRIFHEKASRPLKILYTIFMVTMSLNIFISGGRAGQIGFMVILLFYLAYEFRTEFKKMLLLLATAVAGIVLVFFLNKPFHDRMMLAYHNASNFHANPHTSVGLRINWAINSMELIKEKPLIGFGTGSFKKEYKRINEQKSPEVKSTGHPHNFYIFTLVQFGIVGLLFLLAIFFTLAKIAYRTDDGYRGVRYVFILLFLTIMLSDSYLLGHYTTLFFAYVAALLFGGRVEES